MKAELDAIQAAATYVTVLVGPFNCEDDAHDWNDWATNSFATVGTVVMSGMQLLLTAMDAGGNNVPGL